MTDVAVIGGGIAGLSCAVALADEGLKVIVLERDSRLGGRAGSWRDEHTGDMVDIGPHVVHSEYRNFLAWLERLGTRGMIVWQQGKVLTLACKPRPVILRHWPFPPPFNLLPSLIGAPGLRPNDYFSMMPLSWHAMRLGEEDIPDLDRMNALDYLRSQGVSERLIDWWWRFAGMVVANVPLERCSAGALMRIHAQLSARRNLHFGFAARGLAELYATQAVQAIESAGGRVLMQAEVRGLMGEGRAEGFTLADGTCIQAKYCVSAIPPQDLTALLPDAWKNTPPFNGLGIFEPCPYIACYLWFDRAITDERFISHLWSATRFNYDFYDLSKIRTGWAARPSVMASNIIYSHRAQAMSDEEIVQVTVRETVEFAPRARHARLLHARVHRIPMAICCPLPGTEVRRPDTRSPIPGLLLAGDWIQTHLPSTMESAVMSGWMAAERILLDLGKPKRLAQSPRPYDGIAGLVHGLARAKRKM